MSKRSAPLVLCDTNIFIRLFRKNAAMIKEIKHLGRDRLALSAITKAEVYYGMKDSEVSRTKSLLNLFKIIPLSGEVSDTLVHFMYEYRRERPYIPDCLIAASALSVNAQLFTLNKKHFEYYPALTLYKPKYVHR